MKLQTKFHGEVVVERQNIWTFEEGIPGFEDEKEWVILPIDDEDMYQVLQSVTNAEVALIVANPYLFEEQYDFTLTEEVATSLDVQDESHLFVLTVLTVREPFDQSTWNGQAPLLFNSENKRALQFITHDTRYSVRESVVQLTFDTKFHGEITVNKSAIWTFEEGIPGFEDENEWIILPLDEEDVFQVLQSVHTPSVAFVVTNPYVAKHDYDLTIDEPTIEALRIQRPEELFVLAVVTVREPFHTSTWNAQAPLLFNNTTKRGRQMITNDRRYSTKTPLVQGGGTTCSS